MGIFPRGEKPGDQERIQVNNVNEIIASYDDNQIVFYKNIGKVFLNEDETGNTD